METLNETLKVMVFGLFWTVVLPVVGLLEIGIAMSDKVESSIATHRSSLRI